MPRHHPQMWEWKAVFNPNTFADPSLTVRADITGRYSNRLYTYEPQDMMFRKCPLPCYFVFHLVSSQIPLSWSLVLENPLGSQSKNKYRVRAFAINYNGLTCSSKTITHIVPLNLLGLLKQEKLKDHGWEPSGSRSELFYGEWWMSLCSKLSDCTM